MTTAEYLRRQAAELRTLAHKNPDPEMARQLEQLALRCEKLAAEMANGHDKSPLVDG